MVGMLSPITAQIGQPERVDIGQSILGGMQVNQNLQRGRLQNQDMQQDVSEGDFAMKIRNLQIMNALAKKAKALPPEQRPAFRESQMSVMQSIGVDPSQIAQAPLDNASLDQYISQSDAILAANMPQSANAQFGAQETLKDEAGNLFFATSKRDPKTGQVVAAVAAVDGSQTKPVGKLSVAGSYGLTATERVGQLAQETGAKTRAEQDVKAETQPKIEAAIAEAKTKAKLEAEKQISQQGQLGRVEDATAIYSRLKGADLDLIYGKGEAWYPELFRSQKGIDLMADKEQLVNMLKLGAAGELKGQGSVTEPERKMLADAVTVLGNPNISPEKAREALDVAMKIITRNAGQNFNPEQAAQPAQLSIDDLVNQYAD